MELTSVLTNKLDFLEISRKDVSSLKILLIEMETRVSDWREGALDSRHFINKLCEADAQLKQYEESAAPPGWTCHWDRTHKRYYYTNGVTGDSQWEFPSEEFGGEMEIDTAIEEATPSTQVAESIGTDEQANVPVWSYPATYVPMVQAQVMPVVMATAPVVSSSATAGSFVNPPVPGTECGSEVVPFTASAYFPAAEEPPPPPPGMCIRDLLVFECTGF
ncbi:PREDICTED: formin-binding protein 4-like [Acropora digitifera]|uniref:formin-binding protein 4-like n=1 Tax=Acropora digitifera TaxID=70779 RepID=UPI00077A2344|nr:PREDICTED: formin-binding protein 4-like [Acropora digitifera]XP_015769640.1 PREDICTED: formin-binding protein 4-like [Acropora digitifera]